MIKIPLAKDTIEKKELLDLSKWIMKSPKLTKDKLTEKFQDDFSNYNKVKYSVFVNSGSSANLLIIYALLESGRLKNKKAICASVSWVTTVSPLIQLNFDVSLCDCDNLDLGVDLNHFEHLCKKNRPSIAIIVNVLGHANKIYEIKKICKKYNVILIEDNCEALGSSIKDKNLGTFGFASSYSFYYGHHISTIEGGMVTTNDFDLYNTMLSIRAHGWSRDLSKSYKLYLKKKFKVDEFRELYTFFYSGFNFRPTDLNAFLGLSQLKKINKIKNKRFQNYLFYKKNLDNFWKQESIADIVSSFAYGVIVENRLEVYKYLKSKGIETRPLICGNVGRHPFWIKKFKPAILKNADIVHEYGLYLPNYFSLSKENINFICEHFNSVARPIFFK